MSQLNGIFIFRLTTVFQRQNESTETLNGWSRDKDKGGISIAGHRTRWVVGFIREGELEGKEKNK